MEKVIYKNKFYISVVTVYISFLLVKNGFKTLVMQDFFAAVLLTVQAIVLYQIYLKHRYVSFGIKTWTAFPIVKEGILLGIDFMFLISGGTEFIVWQDTVKSLLFFSAAVLIFWFCDEAIVVEKEDLIE